MIQNHTIHLLSDQELMEAYRKDLNTVYIGALYKRYAGWVYGLSYRYFNNHQDAEDATTNIFCIIMDKLKENSVSYFKSWLYIVSKNYILSYIRQNKNNRHILHEDFSDFFMENLSEEHLNMESDILPDSDDLLKLGIESLRETQQVCLELFYLQSKSYVQIADLTGFEVKQVKSHIQNGKRNLKIFLESKGYQYGQS